MPREMTSEEIREFLVHGTRTAKLATTMADGTPHVMPVWFVLDGDELVFNTNADTVKGRNLRRDSDQFGRRNAVPGELVVRLRPDRVISETDVAGY